MGKSKTTVSIDVEALRRDIQRYANNVCRYAASEIADDLTEAAKLAIQAFYDDYTPVKYHRHFWNFRSNAYRRYYSNPHNRIYRGGVELTPSEMADIYQRKYSTEEVYGSVMEIGSHGPEMYTTVPPMSKSPIQLIIEKRDDMLKNIDLYVDKAKIKAKNDSYSILSL